MNKQEFFDALDELFQEEPGTITESTDLKRLEGWDSMTFVGLIAMVDEKFGFTLEPSVVTKSDSLADILNELGDLVESDVSA